MALACEISVDVSGMDAAIRRFGRCGRRAPTLALHVLRSRRLRGRLIRFKRASGDARRLAVRAEPSTFMRRLTEAMEAL